MDPAADRHLELEVGTVRIPFELLTLLTNPAREAFHGDWTPRVMSDTLGLLYTQLNRIEEEAILARAVDLCGRADFGIEMEPAIRTTHL